MRTPVWDVVKPDRRGREHESSTSAGFIFASFYGQAANQNSLVANTRNASGQLAGYAFLDKLNPTQAGSLLQDVGTLRTLLAIKASNWNGLVSMARGLGVMP